MMRRARIGSAVVVAVAAVVCGGVLVARAKPADSVRAPGRGLLRLVEVLSKDLIAPSAALGKAAGAAGSSAPVAIELTTARIKDRTIAVWEIELVGESALTEIRVDAKNGEIVSTEEERDEKDVRRFRGLLAKGKVGLAEALAGAGGATPGLLLKAELDDEDDDAVWETVFTRDGRSTEVLVSAATGKVVEDGDDGGDDHDDDDGEDDDDDDDGEDDDEDEAGDSD